MTAIIPNTYAEWQHCITQDCGIPLTATYVNQRLEALSDQNNEHTRHFIRCYGQAHYLRVVEWFKEAQKAVA